jgi:sugar phosphate permease
MIYIFRMVIEIATSVFCLKVVRYAIYLWLPLYLKQEVRSISFAFEKLFCIS